jgi:hypothetical protein
MMKRSVFILTAALLAGSQLVQAQVVGKITVPAARLTVSAPVYIDLDAITSEPDSVLYLQEVTGKSRKPVASQVEHGYHRFLWWTVDASSGSGKRTYELVKGKAPAMDAETPIAVRHQDNALLITAHGKKVLQYNFNTVYPPQGVDTVFKRSGFIHPLWSPAGNVMTRINAPDHYHHFGIWNPWTDVQFEGKIVDFWNLVKKEGTVRFSKFISEEQGPVYGGFRALQEHLVLKDDKVALNEVWDIKVYNVGEKVWLWDFTSQLNCATPSPVLLKEYRYGGFGYRATEQWDNKNSKVLTSENKTRKDADASTARWCMLDGDINNGHSGILFMSYPANYNFPEPMRVWPEDTNRRGDVFFSFSPTRNKDWNLAPGRNYVLKYRMLVYENTITPAQAEEVWKSFASLHPVATKP